MAPCFSPIRTTRRVITRSRRLSYNRTRVNVSLPLPCNWQLPMDVSQPPLPTTPVERIPSLRLCPSGHCGECGPCVMTCVPSDDSATGCSRPYKQERLQLCRAVLVVHPHHPHTPLTHTHVSPTVSRIIPPPARTEHLEKQPQAKAGSIWAGAAAQQHCRICHVDCTGLDSCPACKAFVQLR